jgi:hypothetical protein
MGTALTCLGRVSRVASALISLVFSVLVILFFYGYLAPLGLSPSSLLGSSYSSLFGSAGLGASYGPLLPGGIVGLIAFSVISRIGSVTSAATSPSMPSAQEMMKRMNMPAMMGGAPFQSSAPQTLPSDITKSQFVVLSHYRRGFKNPKEIGEELSMDNKEVEKETVTLKGNGYLTQEGRLTSKAMELLGS